MSGRGPAGDGDAPPGETGDDAPSGADGGSAVLRPALEGLAAAARRTAAELSEPAARYAARVEATLAGGGRVLFCGNGGSAATAQHVAAEYAVRFRRRRRPLPAVALGASSPELTAAANDFGFRRAFARALEARGGAGDLLVLHSTSGSSENVVRAAEAARRLGLSTVALTGADGGRLAEAADLCLAVPAEDPARVQELHLAVEHAVVDRVERRAAGGKRAAEPGEPAGGPAERSEEGAVDGGPGR